MKSEGTFWFIQNIIGWIGRPEVKEHIHQMEPIEWRLYAVIIHKIKKDEK